jgi:hypothetical protein
MYGLNAARQPDGAARGAIHLDEYRKMPPGPILIQSVALGAVCARMQERIDLQRHPVLPVADREMT